MSRDALDPRPVLDAWLLAEASLTPIRAGHINGTWRVEHARGVFALQWLNPIFDPAIHLDIEAITARVAAAGLVTPRLVPTREGRLWTEDGQGAWRLLTWIEGETVLRAESPERCREAGRLLGRFHRALWDLEHAFHFSRPAVHDTPRHLAALAQALQRHGGHRKFGEVEPVARAILERAGGLDLDQKLPRRLVHGDPKISNVRFDAAGRAVCLVDLDTLARMAIPMELGDAFRSWCSPSGEEVEARFEAAFFEAGLAGYAEAVGEVLTAEERAAVVGHVEIVAVELAARFCADALNECYFGWDRERFESASAHNLQRARSQLALAQSVAAQRAVLERIAAAVLGRS
jgi:Ser/Thr protein kinase RdoA (MazF antagonist)